MLSSSGYKFVFIAWDGGARFWCCYRDVVLVQVILIDNEFNFTWSSWNKYLTEFNVVASFPHMSDFSVRTISCRCECMHHMLQWPTTSISTRNVERHQNWAYTTHGCCVIKLEIRAWNSVWHGSICTFIYNKCYPRVRYGFFVNDGYCVPVRSGCASRDVTADFINGRREIWNRVMPGWSKQVCTWRTN